MIIIRKTQIQAFEAKLRATFDASVAETFREVWPEKVAELGDLYPTFVHEAIDRAYARDIFDDVDAARFVNLTLLWGMGFDDSAVCPWAKAILANSTAPAGLRIQHLYERSELEVTRSCGTNAQGEPFK